VGGHHRRDLARGEGVREGLDDLDGIRGGVAAVELGARLARTTS
jgi:hypothetical protein